MDHSEQRSCLELVISLSDQKSDFRVAGVRPQMFKSLIGRGHAEFSTNHQQDAQEFFLHFMDKMEKEERNEDVKLKKLFMFQLEDRVQCTSSQQVAYKKREEMMISLPIPLDKATNIGEFKAFEERKKQAETNKERIPTEEIVRLKIPMSECLNEFTADESVEQFYSTAIKRKITALKRTRFATFPDYLVIQLRRFTVGDDWVPKKLDVSVEMEEMIDLNSLRGNGLQSNETQLPDDDGGEEETTVEINEGFVAQLMDMGFPLEACKKAVHYTNNQGVEAAMNWVFEHSQDVDFASPLQLGGGGKEKKKTETFTPNIESVSMLMAMGFTDQQAHKALKKTNNNLEAAAEWMFSNPDELNTSMEVDEPAAESSLTENTMHDGNGKYKLMGFASHMGTSTSCGHYVCHIYKEGRWVIYNDRKVAESETPPRDLGYIYFYKRI
ncbi:ubiquitin carboxyl-terminal hydrolase 5-like [Clytia hemisphaerica]|uniref:ubiquitin carboxyl-terminal hydrolase 5-like n=1 Tax=Clytia hemisphaerica TaxID=252671 RepID=UPI0034D74BB0